MSTIIFALLTAYLLYRFFTILGQDEKITQRNTDKSKPSSTFDKLDLLLRRHKVPTFLKPTFSEILLKDPQFDIGRFIKNATSAHELILTHAIHNTLSEVDNLISSTSKAALTQHINTGQKTRVRNHSSTLIDAKFNNPIAAITLKFNTQLRNSTQIEEDWTFTKDLSQDSPIWIVDSIIAH